VPIGLKLADPIIGLPITLVIVRMSWENWQPATYRCRSTGTGLSSRQANSTTW
jgi:hypothetical protein